MAQVRRSSVKHQNLHVLVSYILLYYTNISEVNLSAFIYRLFQEDFSSIVGINTVQWGYKTEILHTPSLNRMHRLIFIFFLLISIISTLASHFCHFDSPTP